MTAQPRKMSEIMKEMSEILLRQPRKVPSSEAAHVAIFFADVAWNESVGLGDSREGYRNVWETIEAKNPKLWNEFKSNDINAMVTVQSPAWPSNCGAGRPDRCATIARYR
jgi:hypothetical protein